MTQEATEAVIPQWDLADRMRKALRASEVGVQEMAEYLEVSRNAVGNWINGRARPSRQTIRLWSMRCGVPYEWLRDGVTHDEAPRPAVPVEGLLGGCAVRDSNPEPVGLTHRPRWFDAPTCSPAADHDVAALGRAA